MKKIAVIGPESTGKTTLSHQIATEFSLNLVPEYLRTYCQMYGNSPQDHDMVKVAEHQHQTILSQTESFIADTEILSLSLWCELYFNSIPTKIIELIHSQTFDLYLLCNIDIPWVADDQREFPHRRQEHFDLFLKKLNQYQFPFQIITGTGEERFLMAKAWIDQLIS